MTQLNPDIPAEPFPVQGFESINGMLQGEAPIAGVELNELQTDSMGIQAGYFPGFNDSAEVTVENVGQNEHIDSKGRLEAFKDWVINRKTRLIVGAAAVSTAVTLKFNPMDELKNNAVEAAPWVLSGVAASEVAFCVGAVMMVAAIGDKIGNPLTIKKRIPEIAQRANDSKLFKAGFWINAVGAVGDFVVLSAGVFKQMPVESYPVAALTLLDLGTTIATRKLILSGIQNNTQSSHADESLEAVDNDD